jgi:deoxyribodipyrimidine photolyase
VSTALVWFRRDFRLADNPALQAALESGHDLIPVYIHAPHEEGNWAPGAASNAWRHRSLSALDADLRARGSRLVLRQGDSLQMLQSLITETGAEAVFWNRKYEPATQPRDAHIKRTLREQGLQADSCTGAREALAVFIDGALHGYREQRDLPDRVGTSLLSPHLHFGEIAPWRIVHALEAERTAGRSADIDAYIRQLGWRDFSYHLLHHFPKTSDENLNPRFDGFAWASPDAGDLKAWQRGRTGVPIVDAGLRQMWQTGYMHNRVRMIVASYLCKHMRVHWRVGARWFWDTLVDADLANNSMGWQWVGGTGADASPYFRVFNPVTQSEKFDPQARYITRWVPELAGLPVKARFAPWQHSALLAEKAPGYPRSPLVDLAEGRDAALAAYRRTG